MKKILLVFFILSLLYPQNATAQGTYFCSQQAVGVPGNCTNNCDPGFSTNCQKNSDGRCIAPIDGPKPCIPELIGSSDDGSCINTALGCVPIEDSNAIAAFFLRWALGIAGGIAFLLIIFAAFIIITSSGDPKKVQGGKELLTAAISGLVLIIFSVFILRLIGVNILGIF